MNAIQPSSEFTDSLIEKEVFERDLLMLLGRDLQISQSFALEQCRKHVDTILAMWMDGFSTQYTFEHLKAILIEEAKTDEELKWQINPALLEPSSTNVSLVHSSTSTDPIEDPIETEIVSGTVKWYSSKKGFGFIASDVIDEDVFVHHKEIAGSGFRKLNTGESVVFELSETQRGFEALNVRSQSDS